MLAVALVSSIGLSLVAAPAAEAGSKGRRNTALALGAVAVYGVVKKKPLVAGLAGGGALYSYTRSRQAASKERQRRKWTQRRRYSYRRR